MFHVERCTYKMFHVEHSRKWDMVYKYFCGFPVLGIAKAAFTNPNGFSRAANDGK
jgi:hypothetical protein